MVGPDQYLARYVIHRDLYGCLPRHVPHMSVPVNRCSPRHPLHGVPALAASSIALKTLVHCPMAFYVVEGTGPRAKACSLLIHENASLSMTWLCTMYLALAAGHER
jgi:hypothetical protein